MQNYAYIREMSKQRWLVAWIGGTDHEAAEGKLGKDVGPIATALQDKAASYDKVYLLTNYPHERSVAYCDWLAAQTGFDPSKVDLFDIELKSPVDYDAIYAEVSKNLKEARLPRDEVELTFHLSPGTPAMAVIWIILARTRFPAHLIQTTRDKGVLDVRFFTDVTDAFLPEFLQRSGERIERLAVGPAEAAPEFSKIIHRSREVAEQIERARRVAALDVPVLVLGETGTGKELFAAAIHAASQRSNKAFLAVNCGAIAPELANSELFGHVKGAFTGAATARDGHFVKAEGGTLFLDEIGDLPAETQVRLLRALQEQEVTPLGTSQPIKVNVRIVAATHRDLAADVASGRFREDLFHRLAVGILRLPPLRDRDGDVELLLETFLEKINAESRGRPEAQEKNISVAARRFLLSQTWPGNIRELYHTLLRAAIWSKGPTITEQDAQAAVLQIHRKQDNVLGRPLAQGFDLQRLLDDVSRDYIARALKQTGDRKTGAAELLGFQNYQTLSNWMKRLGVETTE